MNTRRMILSMAAVVASLAWVGTASAVSYPTGEVSGNSVPYVTSIMYVDEPGNWAGKTVTGYCTGTFIARGYVVTAAHCVADVLPENLYVGVGKSMKTLAYCAVLSFELHPRYFKRRISVNDIALLRVTDGCAPARYPKLPGRGTTSYSSLMVYGWGLNQNSEQPNELGALRVNDYSDDGERIFGASFNPAMQIAAGRYFANEDIYGGVCSGDSGGPLIAKLGGRATLVGVSSWGTFYGNSCEPAAPSVFGRMANFTKWIPTAKRRISRLIREKDYVYARAGGNGAAEDGIDFFAGSASTSAALTAIGWGYSQYATPAGPVGYSFSIDTNFDGTPDLTGDPTQIVNASGVQQCTAIADTTNPLTPPAFSRIATFPTSCIRKSRQIGDLSITMTAGGSVETVLLDAVAFPPVS